jgi:hypothetical protein
VRLIASESLIHRFDDPALPKLCLARLPGQRVGLFSRLILARQMVFGLIRAMGRVNHRERLRGEKHSKQSGNHQQLHETLPLVDMSSTPNHLPQTRQKERDFQHRSVVSWPTPWTAVAAEK